MPSSPESIDGPDARRSASRGPDARQGREPAADPSDLVARLTAAARSGPPGRLVEALWKLDRSRLDLDLLEAHEEELPPSLIGEIATWLPEGREDPRVEGIVRRALDRAPGERSLLRLAFDAAVASGDRAAADRLAARLMRADSGLATAQHVYRARRRLDDPGPAGVRVALLSSYTLDQVVPYLDHRCRELGVAPEIFVAPFNTWARQLIDAGSDLHEFEPDLTFLSVALDDLVPALAEDPSADRLAEAGEVALERVLSAAEVFVERTGGTLVVHGFHSAHRDPSVIAERADRPRRAQWIRDLNARLARELASLPRTFVIDMEDLLLRSAGGGLESPKMRHLAALRLGTGALPELALRYAGYVAAVRGLTRKCVVLDLDDTLWGGIVGEEGPHGIALGDAAPGSVYKEFQSYLASLKGRGFLLAVSSKNNPDDALEAMRVHEHMVLRPDDFAAQRINWRPKPENVVEIAEELNIGLDSIVFVDDNPHERALMRQALPEVLTVELPEDPSLWRDLLETLPQLQQLVVTETDRARTEQYRERRRRKEHRECTASLEDYLHSLDIEVEIRRADAESLPRIHQLFQRTNQFNLTARRYGRDDLTGFAEDPGRRLYALRARDRFGDHGLVASALVRVEEATWVLDSFLMSCRVIGHGVEGALLAAVARDAASDGARTLIGELVETPKNVPARELYAERGFREIEPTGDARRFALSLEGGGVEHPEWIRKVVAFAA